MTLRDYFAAMAMQGYIGSSDEQLRFNVMTKSLDEGISQKAVIARAAYDVADHMLAERAKAGAA
jgi:hypothetical protein